MVGVHLAVALAEPRCPEPNFPGTTDSDGSILPGSWPVLIATFP
jgi:hypothetical protein